MKDKAIKQLLVSAISERGFVVRSARPIVDGADLFVRSQKCLVERRIRLKAARSRNSWIVNAPRAEQVSDDLFYVFYDGTRKPATIHVVTSKTVATYIQKRNDTWLAEKGHQGQVRNSSSIRHFADEADTYVNAWHIIR